MPRFHRQPLPRLWCLALAFLLVAGSLFAPSPPLYAQDPDVADAPGSISGTVTDAAGVPLTGIRVTLDSQGDHVYRSPIFTNQDGQYAFTFLGAGIYKIGFSDPNAVYGAEFYPGAARLAEAASIPVTGNDVTGVDAHLVVGGVITGTLTFATSAPRNWALEITLWRYDRDLGLQMEHLQSASVPLEDTTLDFAFGGLASDTYYLCVAAGAYLPNDDMYGWPDVRTLNECYDDRAFIDLWHLWGTNTFEPNDLKPIDVQTGETTGAIDMVLGDPADRGSIAGQVQAHDGRPLQGINVALISALAPDRDLRSTVSDEDGRYALADVAPGNYFLRACDETAEFVSRFYRDEDTDGCYYPRGAWPFAAEVVPLAPLETRVDLDLVLNPTAVISGTVMLNGQVPPGAQVAAERLESGHRIYVGSDSTTGQYSFDGLTPGTYELTAYLYIEGTSHQQTYVTDDGQSQISVGAGDRMAGIDFSIEAVIYDWAIEGVVSVDGNPVEGIRVDLFKDGTRRVPLVYATTDANGRFRIEGLAENAYSFRFSDPQHRYATAYSNDLDTPYDPEWIVVRDERRTAVYNITLPYAGRIRGRVFPLDGASLTDYQVQSYFLHLYEYAPGAWVYSESQGPAAELEPDGTYTLLGLYPGVYRVALKDLNSDLPVVFYPQASFDAARNLHVTAGSVVGDVNFYPGRGPGVYLPLLPGD